MIWDFGSRKWPQEFGRIITAKTAHAAKNRPDLTDGLSRCISSVSVFPFWSPENQQVLTLWVVLTYGCPSTWFSVWHYYWTESILIEAPVSKNRVGIQSGAAGCVKSFVACFLEVRLACLGSMAASVQPSCLWNSQKTCYETFSSTCRPRL